MKRLVERIVRGDATREQAKDTGMAVVLILLLVGLARRKLVYMDLAVVTQIVNMIVPQIFRPAAVIWFGFSHLIGTIVSRVIMTAVFFLVVTPIGMWRRLSGADVLRLRTFRSGSASVMEERNHTFTAEDMEQPY